MSKLPDKPSELIRVALADLAKCELDPRYRINMGTWHKPTDTEEAECMVCLAGAVMAKSLGAPMSMKYTPSVYAPDDVSTQKLYALDLFRTGEVIAACERLESCGAIDSADLARLDISDERMSHYEAHEEAFKREMEGLAADLEANGL